MAASTTLTAGHGPASQDLGALDVGTLCRIVLFLAVLALGWIGTQPFSNLADPALLGVREDGNLLNQVVYPAAALAVVIAVALIDIRIFRVFLQPMLLATLGWLALAVLASNLPMLSARRFAFSLTVIVVAGLVLVLPRNRRQLADLLAAAALGILVLSYAGVMLAPNRAVHQVWDVVESALAGYWRGLYAQKNIAAAVMTILVFVGLFVARVRNALLGWTIVVLALGFVVGSGGKSATALLPVVLGASLAMAWCRSRAAQALFALGPVLLLAAFAPGAGWSESIRKLAATVMSDPTFTGRTDIWAFAGASALEKPLLGYGFGAFWRTGDMVFAEGHQSGATAHLVAHAHNGYLELVLAGGLPALAFAIGWIVLAPLRDFARGPVDAADRPLALLFARLWLFGLYLACFESILLDRASPMWFSMLVAMFGLRLLTTNRTRP